MTILKLIYNNITTNKLKYIITILSVTISIGSVILISSITTLGEMFLKEQLKNSGVTSFFINSIDEPLQYEDMVSIKKEVETIDNISPFLVEENDAYIRGKSDNVMIWGVAEDTEKLVGTKPIYGKFIDKKNIDDNEKVCIIDKNLAIKTYGRENIVGKDIGLRINDTVESYKVIGIIDSSQNIVKSAMGDNLNPFVYIPFSTMQEMGGYESFDRIAFTLKDGNLSEEKAEVVESVMKREFGKNVSVSPVIEGMSIIDSILITVKVILTLIASISMVISGFMIMMVMITSVKDRTLEIGIKKALGAKNNEILKEFLLEAVIISLISFVISFFVVNLLLYPISYYLSIQYVLDVKFTLLIFLSSLVIGVVFGVYPSIKASKLSPVEAFKK